MKAGSLARACSAVGRNAISVHFRFSPIQTTITAVLEVLLIALACFLAGLFARTMRAQRIVRDLSQTLRHWIGDTVQRARSGRANLIGLLMKSMQFRLVLGINEPPLTNGFPGGPSSRRSHASLQCSSQKALAAHDDTTLVMMDLVNYSATETLRDGRAVEIRAQRSQDREGMQVAIARSSSESLHRRFFAVRRECRVGFAAGDRSIGGRHRGRAAPRADLAQHIRLEFPLCYG